MKNESANVSGQAQKLGVEIKKTWGKLTDEEVGFYESSRDKFFAAVKSKYSITMDDAERTVRKLDAACAAACTEEGKRASGTPDKAANDSSASSKPSPKAANA